MSLVSSRSASSVSLMSSITSSDSDYRSCIDEMATEESSSDEFLFDEADLEELGIPLETEMNEADLEESVIPLEAEVDDQPSTVLIYSTVATSPILFLPSLPPLSVILPETADRAVQSGEHDFSWPIGSPTISPFSAHSTLTTLRLFACALFCLHHLSRPVRLNRNHNGQNDWQLHQHKHTCSQLVLLMSSNLAHAFMSDNEITKVLSATNVPLLSPIRITSPCHIGCPTDCRTGLAERTGREPTLG